MQTQHLEDRQAIFSELVERTFTLVVLFVSGSVWLWLWVSVFVLPPLPYPALSLCFVVTGLCIVTRWLRRVHSSAAAYGLVLGLWVCLGWSAQQYPAPFFLYLFSLLILIAYTLTNAFSACGIMLLSSLFLLINLQGAPLWEMAPPILMMWFTLATSYIVFHKFYEAIHIAWQYGDYAVQQMQDAREHRAELVWMTKALKETQERLEHANIQLSHARNTAEEARRLKALFAANVSHELRTPINLIVGFSEMMITAPKTYGVPLPSAYWTDINIVYRNARHLQSLINDVLDISQVEAGQMAMIKGEVNPASVILEAVELVRESITRRGLLFEMDIPPQLPCIWLDRVRIRQVILNLLSNAMRFTDDGTITVQAAVEDNFLSIRVSDTGIGIGAEDLHYVFKEFHQLENSLSKRQSGSGLGLALSKQFIEMHGGQIRVESAGIPGQGTSFVLTLPFTPRSPHWKFLPQRLPTPLRDKGQSVLVMDDDPAIVQLFERYTGRHRIMSACNAEEALNLIQTVRPAALVLDNRETHVLLLESLQSLGIKTPVISCSMPSGRRILKSVGVTDYLVKPVTSETLLCALQRLPTPVRRVLIVDDEPDIVRMFSRMLNSAAQPYEIWKAYNGREGLQLMEEQQPDVVVLDVLMPEVDGFGVIASMKSTPALEKIPIVLTSARGTFDAISPTVDGLISVCKPDGFQPVELIHTVEAIVDMLIPATAPAP